MAKEAMSNKIQGNATSAGWEHERCLSDSRWALASAGPMHRVTPVAHSLSDSWLSADAHSNDWDHGRFAWEAAVTGIVSLYHGIVKPEVWAESLSLTPVVQEESSTEIYRGTVRNVIGSVVLVEVDSPDNPDIQEAYIPLASFERSPETGEEFTCEVITHGAVTITRADLLPRDRQPTLEDFGIDEQELFGWASSLDL